MPFEIPEDITVLDDTALAEALSQALTEAAEFESIPDADLDDEKFARLLALADFATAAKDAQAERSVVAGERAERAAAARAALAPPVVEDVVDAEVVEEEEPAEAPKETVSAAAAPAKRVQVVARVAAKTPIPIDITPARPTAVLTASADVPGFATGGQLNDLDHVGKAMTARMKGLPTSRIGGDDGVQMRYSVAQIDKGATRTDGLIQGEDNDQSLLARASREARLPGGSLTAAGGWCAPSETLYDLCTIESTDGLLDLPSVTVNRGGIRFTKGPSFADIYGAPGLGWILTEAQVIAGTPAKTCLEIACPPFVDVRLDAVGLCIKAPLLTQAAYPELVRRWIEGALIAHQHVVDANLIGRIVNGSTALDGPAGVTTIDSLTELELVASYKRQQWRMRFGETLEVLAPYWYKTVIRGDLSRRTGVDLINVSDAQIEGYFSARNLRVQWLYNYQPLVATAGAVAVPDEVEVIVYPAGTWVKGTTDVISLDAVYDSQNLLQNQYTALFVEEGVLVANTCFDSSKVTLNTCASGQTGAADLTDCLVTAATP